MPLDLYKTLGYDYRDKQREAKLAVDSDVERARRITEMQQAADLKQASALEGIARRRFTENYAKALGADGQTEDLGAAAEAAWAKKVAADDLNDARRFEDIAGRLPGTRELAKSDVATKQGAHEVAQIENQERQFTGLARMAGLFVPGLDKAISATVGTKIKKDLKEAEAGLTKAETDTIVNRALQTDAADYALSARDMQEQAASEAILGQRIGNERGQLLNQDATMRYGRLARDLNLEEEMKREALYSDRIRNDQQAAIGAELKQAELERILAAAELARSRASGRQPLIPGVPGAKPAATTKAPSELTADQLIFNAR